MPNFNQSLRDIAWAYCEDNRQRYELPSHLVEGHYIKVNEDLARRISREYEQLPEESLDWGTEYCYNQLRIELVTQWYYILGQGYHLEPWTKEGQPYQNSEEMRADLRDNRHLFFFTGGEPHPFLNSKTHTGYTGNEMLRAVHDVFGHAAEGFGFGPRGEENAWIHHSMMFSPLAQRALTTETRGQNSWVNFGPNAHLPASERPYADQKVALLPEWACDWKEALNG
jgi:hypothetical protein